jgi:hypothetical protein
MYLCSPHTPSPSNPGFSPFNSNSTFEEQERPYSQKNYHRPNKQIKLGKQEENIKQTKKQASKPSRTELESTAPALSEAGKEVIRKLQEKIDNPGDRSQKQIESLKATKHNIFYSIAFDQDGHPVRHVYYN